jgi:hypothetical protein
MNASDITKMKQGADIFSIYKTQLAVQQPGCIPFSCDTSGCVQTYGTYGCWNNIVEGAKVCDASGVKYITTSEYISTTRPVVCPVINYSVKITR